LTHRLPGCRVRCNRNPNESAQLLALVRTLNKSAPRGTTARAQVSRQLDHGRDCQCDSRI